MVNILYLPNEYSQQRQREKKRNIWPVLMAMEATYLKNKGINVFWDKREEFKDSEAVIHDVIGLDFMDLPIPDRILTDAFNSKYQENGNFKYLPGTYIQSALDCWYAKCTFCEWAKKYPVCKTRPVEVMIEEIKQCKSLGFNEVFDDSGTFPIGDWLEQFCKIKIDTPYIRKYPISCNMRITNNVDFKLMKQAGFRMLLFGVESANQKTLDILQKGIKYEDIIPVVKKAADAGLEPHIAVMFGYPWENKKKEHKTLKLVHYLLRKGYAKTAQASVYTHNNVRGNDNGFCSRIYGCAYFPEFWYNKIKDIHNIHDLKYLIKQIKAGLNGRRSIN